MNKELVLILFIFLISFGCSTNDKEMNSLIGVWKTQVMETEIGEAVLTLTFKNDGAYIEELYLLREDESMVVKGFFTIISEGKIRLKILPTYYNSRGEILEEDSTSREEEGLYSISKDEMKLRFHGEDYILKRVKD